MTSSSPSTSSSATTTASLPPSNEVKTTTGYLNGKEVKVYIKEIQKHTAACEACRARKRKCDGHAPCSYCVTKGLQCVFAAQRKRGPPAQATSKNRRVDYPTQSSSSAAVTTTSGNLVSAQHESEMLDFIEAKNFNEFYGRFVRLILPLSHYDFMRPKTVPHKVQSFIALAYIARISGATSISQKYISQARILSGTIYDSPDVHTIAAMLMFGSYFSLINQPKLKDFYVNLASGLSKLVPFSIGGKLGVFLNVSNVLRDPDVPRSRVCAVMESTANSLINNTIEDIMCRLFVRLVHAMYLHLQFNILHSDQHALNSKFRLFDNLHIGDEQRHNVYNAIDEFNTNTLKMTNFEESLQLRLFHAIEFPLYRLIADFASGHVTEGVNGAMHCLNGLQSLKSADALGTLAEVPMVLLIGSSCRLLHQFGYSDIAMQIFEYVKLICKLMEPEYNFILSDTEFSVDGTPATMPVFSALDRNIFNYPHITTYSFPSSPTPSFPSETENSPRTPSPFRVDTPYNVAPAYSDSIFDPPTSSSTAFTSTISIPSINCSTTSTSIPTSCQTANLPPLSNAPPAIAPPTSIPIPQTYALNSMNFAEMPIENNDLETILHLVNTDNPDFNV